MEQKVKTKGKTIKLRPVTAERLGKLKHKGQSWDGVIAELIDHFEKKEGESK
jgi:predicted CopG family antitoxin